MFIPYSLKQRKLPILQDCKRWLESKWFEWFIIKLMNGLNFIFNTKNYLELDQT